MTAASYLQGSAVNTTAGAGREQGELTVIPQAIRTTIALIGLLVLASPVVSAADGDLDPWFGTGGKVTTAFPGGAFGAAVAVDQARKIVVAGAAAGASGMGEIALARYDADGDLDSTFGDGGRVTTPIAGGNGDERGRSRSRRMAASWWPATTRAGSRSRASAEGRLDRAFAGDGTVGAVASQVFALAVAVQRG